MASTWNPGEILARVRKGAGRGLLRGGEAVREEATRRINEPPKTGRIYRRRGVSHQASAPGESPAADTGYLARNIDVELDLPALRSSVVFRTAYARRLEMGFVGVDSKGRVYDQAPRPYARVSLLARGDEIKAALAEDIAAELRK